MARSKSSNRWLQEHFADEYVKAARQQGYRSRAAFKLLEIQQKNSLIKPGMLVVDMGAAPGGWAQIAAKIVGKTGKVIALDQLPMQHINGVQCIQGDFREEAVLAAVEKALDGQQADLVISDIAPNISGNESIDQPRAMYLAELVLDFTRQHLCNCGDFLVKVFQGGGFPEYYQSMQAMFAKVMTRKPKSSRLRSREVYLLGLSKR